MKPLNKLLIDRPRERLAQAGHNIPPLVLLAVWVQLAVVAVLLLYWLYCLALYFDRGASETDLVL